MIFGSRLLHFFVKKTKGSGNLYFGHTLTLRWWGRGGLVFGLRLALQDLLEKDCGARNDLCNADTFLFACLP